MARSPRRHPLDPLLLVLRAGPPETLLRPLPEGCRQRVRSHSTACSSTFAIPARSSSGGERTSGPWHAPIGPILNLHPDQSLSSGPVDVERSLRYETLGEGLHFSTAPYTEETEITGPLAAKLFISSTTSDADLFLILQLFDPAGNEITFEGSTDPNTPIANGWLRASHRALDPDRSLPWRPFHPHDRCRATTTGGHLRARYRDRPHLHRGSPWVSARALGSRAATTSTAAPSTNTARPSTTPPAARAG